MAISPSHRRFGGNLEGGGLTTAVTTPFCIQSDTVCRPIAYLAKRLEFSSSIQTLEFHRKFSLRHFDQIALCNIGWSERVWIDLQRFAPQLECQLSDTSEHQSHRGHYCDRSNGNTASTNVSFNNFQFSDYQWEAEDYDYPAMDVAGCF